MATESDKLQVAFAAFRAALGRSFPAAAAELRQPVPLDLPYATRAGAEQVTALWSQTSGQAEGKDGTLGVAGGLRLLGPAESERERRGWLPLMSEGTGLDAVAKPAGISASHRGSDPVRPVYFAAGWIPVLAEPYEANYLAVDLVPLPGGHPGQIILCGRDEDKKCVIAPDLAAVFRALAAECEAGDWTMKEQTSRTGKISRHIERDDGRLPTSWRIRPPAAFATTA